MENTKRVATENYEIVIRAKRIKGENASRKFDFLAYEGYDKDGHKCKFKFTQAVKNLPTEAGEYVFVIPKNAINKDKRVRWNEYWVRDVISCEAYVPHFDETVEDLPF